ncbi:MAG: hypothetical protein WBL35_10240 [Ornithinibacter sp.]
MAGEAVQEGPKPANEESSTPADDETSTGHSAQEIVTVLLISIVAVLTAWCGFQSSKWGGEMSIAFSQASSARIQAASADGEARSATSFDLTIYASWVNAVAEDKQALADYIEERFTPHFKIAFDDWESSGRELNGPFAEESYVPPGEVRANELSARADTKFAEALENNARGDRYSLLTVMFALVLFFAAMSSRNFAPWAARTFLGLAAVLAVTGAAILSTYPVII